MKKLLFLLFIAASLISCDKKHVSENSVLELSCMKLEKPKFVPPVTDGEVEKGVANKTSKVYTKKIIKDGEISICVKDIYEAKKQVDGQLRKFHAYYENESLTNNKTDQSYDLKIRIPSQLFEKFIGNLENGTGDVTKKSITARDVTDEYIDVEARLKNKKLYLEKYTELLSKAGNIKDILALQEKIRLIQEEIESKEGRLKYLNDQINYSTLDLTLFIDTDKTPTAVESNSFLYRLKSALTGGWKAFVSAIIGLINLWPFIIILVGLIMIFRRYRKRKRAKAKESETQTSL
ncbi:DUF4349 domain-containing protein [Parabacteroides sp. FAFU027]|uniref:DUF4349 domain-containing protein n=1 Tax=Parabacteroides sp. FAFU027 TaxID=2922715 RepID=UPI001FAF2220|nr:DUF4349 domain-containing protein [Parabacteroides sp. FAFU027]